MHMSFAITCYPVVSKIPLKTTVEIEQNGKLKHEVKHANQHPLICFSLCFTKGKAFWILQLQTFVIASSPAYRGWVKARKSELNGEGRQAKAVIAIQKCCTVDWPCLLQNIFESLCREEVLIMAVIKLKMGIKDVVRKDTLTAENPGSIAINLSVSGLLVLTLYPTPPPKSLHSHLTWHMMSLWPRPETTWV